MVEIVFYGNVPTKKNNRRLIQRGRRRISLPSLAYTQWERAESARLKALHGAPKLDRYRVVLRIYYPDNKVRDADNTLTSVMDCLKAAGLIKDDRHQYQIAPPKIESVSIDRENPRVEVVLHDC